MNEYELYHHGVLGMHWGIRRYQPYPKGHKGGKEVGAAKKSRVERGGERLNRKGLKKLTKIDKKAEKSRIKANAGYQKAIKKSNSIFGTQKQVDKALDTANKYQKKVNKLDIKGQKYYKRVSKKLSKVGIDENPELKKLGEEYIRSVNNISRSMYIGQQLSGKKKR